MLKLLNTGDMLEVDVGNGFQPYTARNAPNAPRGYIGIVPLDTVVAAGDRPPSYQSLSEGEEVRIRKGDQERRAKVRGVRDGMVMLGPAAMGAVSDCPYCWQEGVPGVPAGKSAASSARELRTGPVDEHTCPECGEWWYSNEHANIVAGLYQ